MHTPVLFSQGDPVASRHVVEMHRELHHPPIEGQEDVQHRAEVIPSQDVIVRFAPSRPVLLGHLIHPDIVRWELTSTATNPTDTDSSAEMEIERIDRFYRRRPVSVSA